MDKKLKDIFIKFIIVLLVFSLVCIVTEEVSLNKILKEYSNGKQVLSLYVKPPDANSINYHRGNVYLWLTSTSLSLILPFLLILLGISNKLKEFFKDNLISITIYIVVTLLILKIFEFPLDYYAGFLRKHSYGLSTQSFNKWFVDWLKYSSLNIATTSMLFLFIYMMMKKKERFWWAIVGGASIVFLFISTYLNPTVIDPLFNKYSNVKDVTLEMKINNLVGKTIVGKCNVFEVNKSEETKEMNAYMTGLANSKRIVLWDTTIKQLTDQEVLCIVAHEMGHYILGHIWKAVMLGGTLLTLIFFLVYKVGNFLVRILPGSLRIYSLRDKASLPLLIILINIFMFLASPPVNYYSRYTEKEADRFELELTRDNVNVIKSTIKLHENSLVLPEVGVLYKAFNYNHPTFIERVNFAEEYTPWSKGEPIKYGRYITNIK